MSTDSPGSKPTRVRWRIVILLMGIVFLAHFNRISISVAANAELIGPGKLSEDQMGSIYLAFLLVYTLGMLPGGWLIDRIGPRLALTGMGLGLGFWATVTGLLGKTDLAIAAMFVPLLVIRGLAGATSVPLHPAAARSVSLWFPVRQRCTANGLVNTGALLGIAFTYPVFGWLLDHLGWPTAFMICGLTLMLFAVLWHTLSADRPAEHPACNDAECELLAHEAGEPRTTATLLEVLSLFRNRSLVLLTLSYGALGYVQYLFFYWIEYYFKNVLKVEAFESRMSALVITLAMAAGMTVGGWVSDEVCRRIGPRWGYRLIALTGMGLSAACSLLGLGTPDPNLVTMWFSLSFFSLGLCEGIFWTTAPMLERKGGLACAFLNTGGNGIGMLAPLLTPIIGERFGWDAAVFVACVACGIGGLLWFGIDDSRAESRVP